MALSLQVSGVGKTFNKPLFEGVDLVVEGSVKKGLIGEGNCTTKRVPTGGNSF